MESDLRDLAEEAIQRLDALLAAERNLPHDDVRHVVSCVVAFRNGAIRLHREGKLARNCLDGANASLSLAYGAQFPLAGTHPQRLEQVRDTLRALVDAAPD